MRIIVIFFLLAASGCASIAQGQNQDIAIRTDPSGAQCTISRDGRVLSTVENTPATVDIERSGDFLLVDCEKAGFSAETAKVHSQINAAFWYNFYWLAPIITFPVTIVGVIVDVSTGAYHQYDSPVDVTLPEAPST